MMRSGRWLSLLCVAALWLSACGANSIHAGAACGADLDCASGSCLSFDTFPDAGNSCVAGPKVCSRSCTADADCTPLDPSRHWACFSGCGGTRFCGQTQ
jgi:hypothetical protein